jgi:hypothetical protein
VMQPADVSTLQNTTSANWREMTNVTNTLAIAHQDC